MGRNDFSCNWAMVAPKLFYYFFIMYALHTYSIPLRKENRQYVSFLSLNFFLSSAEQNVLPYFRAAKNWTIWCHI